jgi:class 3 adenylate cyclase
MFTDLSGFSRRTTEFGILHFLQTIYEQRKLLLPIVQRHDGLLLKEEGDSFLIMFRRPERAVECGIAMQRACRNVNERRKPEEQILLCLGIGYGRVLRIGDADVWGREVNGASKLGEDTAKPYEILVTTPVKEALGDKAGFTYEDIGAGSFGGDPNFKLIYE